MNLTVVGGGYVGLVTAAVFAGLGNKVTVIENDAKKLRKLQFGELPFFEPELENILLKESSLKRLLFTGNFTKGLKDAEIVFICVGTPAKKNGKADLCYVYGAVKSIAQHLTTKPVIVLKSTVPPGTNDKVASIIKKYSRLDLPVASVPEFLREGSAVWDSLHPSRIIIGTTDKIAVKKLLQLHKKINAKKLICSPASAQMIKYASNAFLPTKISFANSIAVLCDKLGANVQEVLKGMGMDKRIGPDFLGAGVGYGGSCFPKDVDALINLAKENNYNFKILEATAQTNKKQIDYFIKKIINLSQGSVKGKIMTVLGFSFKPNTSDIRYSRSINIIEELLKKEAIIRVCDPVAIPQAVKIFPKIDYFVNPYDALFGSDGLVLVTEWEDYKKLDFRRIKKIMRCLVVADGRNIYNRSKLEKLGFIYGGIGQ